ncbi:MAG TPA: alpha/beta hydrolase, partial [Pyrinomonadaceae bacterium]|nr:alpha/beta hydrolase [Pyrinomonadaceae bacterium]
ALAADNRKMRTTAFLLPMVLTIFLSSVVLGQQKLTTGYAPVNGLKMYYEIYGNGEPLVMIHGAFMAISGDWADWVNELSKTRKVIAVEMQGHGRTADINRDISPENLADDVSALLDYLKIPQSDILGYSLGAGAAMQCAIRHPDKVRKVVVISYPFRRDGWVKEVNDGLSKITAEVFKGSPMEAEYKRLNPNPNDFAKFVKHVITSNSGPWDFDADKLKATVAPMFFINGDADGVKLETLAEMYSLKGGAMSGYMQPRSESRLAIIPNTTHVTLMQRMLIIIPMVNDFLEAKPQNQ